VQIAASLGGFSPTAIVEQIEHAQLKPCDIRTGRSKAFPYLTRSSWVAYASTNGVASLQKRGSDVTPQESRNSSDEDALLGRHTHTDSFDVRSKPYELILTMSR